MLIFFKLTFYFYHKLNLEKDFKEKLIQFKAILTIIFYFLSKGKIIFCIIT